MVVARAADELRLWYGSGPRPDLQPTEIAASPRSERNEDMETRMLLKMIAVLGLSAGMAQAQVAPPPPAEKPAEPEYTPEPTQPAAQPQTQTRPRPATRNNPGQATRHKSIPTDVPYPKLAQRGADGQIVILEDLPDILALRANPMVGDGSVDAIMPVVYGRRARFEMLVIENLDLYWELSAGAIDNLDMSDLTELSRVAEMVKPLVGKTTLTDELTNRAILTRTQGDFNSHIVQEYKKAVSEEIQAREGTDGLSNFMKFVLNDSLHESRLAYQGLLVEAKTKSRELLDRLGIENEAIANLNGMISSDPEVVRQEVAEFDAAVRTLSIDNGIRFFTELRSTRENPNISPTVTRLDVLHDRKVVYKGGLEKRDLKGDEPIIKGLEGKTAKPPQGESTGNNDG